MAVVMTKRCGSGALSSAPRLAVGSRIRHGRVKWAALIAIGALLAGPISPAAAQGLSEVNQLGTLRSDSANGVAVDAEGARYVVGRTAGALPGQSSAGGSDAFVRKYGADGDEEWTRQFGSGLDDVARSVAVAGDGAILVAGDTQGALPGQSGVGARDAFVRKYHAGGDEEWTRQFGSGLDDGAYGVAVSAGGAVSVAGSVEGALPGQSSEGGLDAFLRTYSAGGNEVITHQFGTDGEDEAYAVATGPAGSVSVAGAVEGALPGQTSAGGSDAFLRRYDAGGAEVFTRQFGAGDYDEASSVAVDASGAVAVGGSIFASALPEQTSAGGYDAFVRKYDTGGTEVFTHQFGSEGQDEARAVAVDADGGISVAGYAGRLPEQVRIGGSDVFVRRYTSEGAETFTHQLGSVEFDEARSLAIDATGATVLAGRTSGALPAQIPSGDEDAYVATLHDLSDDDGRGVFAG